MHMLASQNFVHFDDTIFLDFDRTICYHVYVNKRKVKVFTMEKLVVLCEHFLATAKQAICLERVLEMKMAAYGAIQMYIDLFPESYDEVSAYWEILSDRFLMIILDT